MHRYAWVLFAAGLCAALPSAGHDEAAQAADRASPPAQVNGDGEAAKAALATVERFERALAAGDRGAALEQLAPGLVVFESGHAERTRDEYAASHLDADIAFLKTAQSTLQSRRIDAMHDSATVLSESEVRSERDGKTTTRASLETLVLQRAANGWRITHIHWSSRELKR